MRARWMLVASILVLTLIPGALRAADAPGCAPTATAAAVASLANATASEPAPAATPLPIWAGLPSQPSPPQTLQGLDGTPIPLFNSCSGCTFALCQRLHSCLGCC